MVYTLLITVAAAALAGRILAVARVYEPWLSRPDPRPAVAAELGLLGAGNSQEVAALLAAGQPAWSPIDPDEPRGVWPATRPEPMPTLGDNDRSRWDTVRALVDHGTYAIGHRDLEDGGYHDRGIITEDGWRTIDKVLNPATLDFYSSKPPLLPTLVAGEYWLLKQAFDWSITKDRFWVVRVILLTVNWLPFVAYLALLARLVERLGTTDWGRLYVVAAGCFATFVTPFAISFNNHTVATCSALFALYPAVHIWSAPRTDAQGRGASPADFALAGFFAAFTACNELPALAFTAALCGLLLVKAPFKTLTLFVPAAAVPLAGFLVTNYLAVGQLSPAYGEFGGPWYAYAGSHWIEPAAGVARPGIDWAPHQEGKAVYAFHVLLGHHGLFSLSPVFLLALAGIAYSLARRGRGQGPGDRGAQFFLAGLTLFLAVVVIGFYVLVVRSRNYGGWTSGLRWLMWLTPFWLLNLLPVADRLARRRGGRVFGYFLLAVSVLSVSYPAWNPWRHPWFYDFLESQGWIRY
jgi:hypothetical protein